MASATGQRLKQRLRAQYAVSRILAEANSLAEAAPKILEALCQTTGWVIGTIWEVDTAGEKVRPVEVWQASDHGASEFAETTRRSAFAPGEGLPGRVWAAAKPVWIADVAQDANFPRQPSANREGLHAALGFPIRLGGRVLGVLEFFSGEIREPDEEVLRMVEAIGNEMGQFVERGRAQEQLRENGARRMAILATAPDCIISIDHTGRITEWNPAAERAFGYSSQQAVGCSFSDLVVPPGSSDRNQAVQRLLAGDETSTLGLRMEWTGRRRDGSLFPLEMTVARTNLEGPPVFMAYLRDITERKRTDLALAEKARLLDLSFDAVLVREADNTIIYWNQAAEDLYGWSKDEAVGREVHALLQTRFPEPLEQIEARLQREGRWQGELTHRRRDGSVVPVLSRWALDRDGSGASSRVLETDSDITEHKRAEEALRRSQQQLQRITDAVPALISHLDTDLRYQFVNQGYTEWFGLSCEDIQGRHVREVLGEETYATLREHFEAALGGRTTSFEKLVPYRHGGSRYVRGTYLPDKSPEGQVRGLYVLVLDVTAHKEAERILAESEARLEGIVTSAMDAIITVDSRQRIVLFNPAAEKMFGCPAGEAIGTSLDRFIPARFREAHAGHIGRFREAGVTARRMGALGALTGVRKTGEEFPIEASISQVEVGGESLFTVILRDITERERAEQRLRASETEFRAMFELAGSGKCQTDPATGQFVRVNRKLCEITGYGNDELLGMTFAQLTHPADRDQDLRNHQRLLQGEVNEYSVEKRYRRKDGRTVWVHVATAVIRDPAGEPIRTVGVVHDITDRKRVEGALRESEERYRLILENALEYAILTLDREGRVETWSSGAERILGFAEDEVRGQRLDLIFSEADRQHGQLEIEMKRALEEGRAEDERWHVRKGGSPFWASGLMMPLRDEEGLHRGFLKILRDQTSRKAAEEALRDSEAKFRHLAEAMPQMAWTALVDGEIDYYNKRFYEYTGIPEGQAGLGIWKAITHPDDLDQCLEGWKAAVKSGQIFQTERRLRDERGEYRWFLTRAVPVRNEQGVIVRWYGTSTDIDDQKRNEQRLARLSQTLVSVLGAFPDVVFVTGAQGEIEFKNPAADRFAHAVGMDTEFPEPIRNDLEQVLQTGEHHLPTSLKVVHRFLVGREERYFLSRIVGMKASQGRVFGAVVMLLDVTEFRLLDEVKTNLISTVSHELKTPITSLRTALLVLLDQGIGALNGQQAEMLAIARDETERLLHTLNSLLDLTRFEEDAIGMRLEPATAADLVKSAVEETAVAAERAGIAIKVELEENLPRFKVDRDQIVHVLTNFLTNAIKYSPKDTEVRITVRRHDPQSVWFGVKDRGPGVPPQYHTRIFDKFFRVPGTPKKGAGLGLAIAREVIRAHGGRIGVETPAGQGSEFYFLLPVAEPE